ALRPACESGQTQPAVAATLERKRRIDLQQQRQAQPTLQQPASQQVEVVALIDHIRRELRGSLAQSPVGDQCVGTFEKLIKAFWQSGAQSMPRRGLRAHAGPRRRLRPHDTNLVAARAQSSDQLLDVDRLPILRGCPMVIKNPHAQPYLAADPRRNASNISSVQIGVLWSRVPAVCSPTRLRTVSRLNQPVAAIGP